MKSVFKNGEILIQGKYYLYNNLWGAATGEGSQSLWESSFDNSHIAWGTSWLWNGQTDTIKSYAAVVWGWHWGWKIADTGLPIKLTALRSLLTKWSFDVTHTILGGTNVSYDIWLTANPTADNENPTGEVMVWLYNTGDITPIGSRKANLLIDGVGWDLWEGSHPVSGWPVYSFVRTDNTKSDSLDLNKFFQYLISFGLDSTSYLLSVEAGVEVFTGEGRLNTTHYSINVECR